ncbi:hypothetical protein [Thermaurantiacus tibetensis]|uniref:hypothetical protein n=1 Tax=Thermaurantiacus tibetensis TaxID=2759035 RepID=UPI00188F3778|nr:hypothetical protein [Thermaurantiacus tibetensis]
MEGTDVGGVIFVPAIAIDIAFRPVEPLLMALVQQGSSDENEIPLHLTMDRTRLFVQITHVLLFVASWLGVTPGEPLL